jgi:enoyl-CoA hydratase
VGSVAEVDFRVDAGVGRITLNRPQALNALTPGMVRAVDERLVAWADDDAVRSVVVSGAGERGLCAGGDIRFVHDDARSGAGASYGFWADEYRMNARIARFPKPYIAFMDGIVMGGGVGVSAHGSLRVGTERTRLAMPEVAIGLAPDVGGTYLLSRAPGGSGMLAALTGGTFSAADGVYLGLVDVVVPAERLPLLLATPDEELIRAHAVEPGPSWLAQPWVDECFSADTVEEVVARLERSGHGDVAAEILAKSPTAVKVTFEAMRRARELPDLESVLEQEYRVSAGCFRDHDLVEGIRARIVDKDRNPRWSPATLAEVDDEAVARHFVEPAVPFSLTQAAR